MTRHLWQTGRDQEGREGEARGIGLSYPALRWIGAIGTIFAVVWAVFMFIRSLEVTSIEREIATCKAESIRIESDRKEADRDILRRLDASNDEIQQSLRETRKSLDDLRAYLMAKGGRR